MTGGRWLLPLAPLVPALVGSALAAAGAVPNPIIYLRADVATLALLGDAGLALLIAALVWGDWARRRALARARDQATEDQRRALARARDQATEERHRFLRRLDHELKNPLTAIWVGVGNLEGVQDEAARRRTLGNVVAQADRLGQLTAGLRKLADLESGQTELDLAPVDLAELLKEVVEQARKDPKATHRTLKLDLQQVPWALPKVIGDPDLLLGALDNLLGNALKFTRDGDEIQVRALEDGKSVIVVVADTGPGIPTEDQAFVWEELYRGHTDHAIPGSGLGLPYVRAIVKLHGGWADLRSRAGEGTVVTVQLPSM